MTVINIYIRVIKLTFVITTVMKYIINVIQHFSLKANSLFTFTKYKQRDATFLYLYLVHKMLYMFQAVPPSIIRSSWWWAEEPPETCRASCELNRIEKSCISLVVLCKCTYDAQTYKYQTSNSLCGQSYRGWGTWNSA